MFLVGSVEDRALLSGEAMVALYNLPRGSGVETIASEFAHAFYVALMHASDDQEAPINVEYWEIDNQRPNKGKLILNLREDEFKWKEYLQEHPEEERNLKEKIRYKRDLQRLIREGISNRFTISTRGHRGLLSGIRMPTKSNRSLIGDREGVYRVELEIVGEGKADAVRYVGRSMDYLIRESANRFRIAFLQSGKRAEEILELPANT